MMISLGPVDVHAIGMWDLIHFPKQSFLGSF